MVSELQLYYDSFKVGYWARRDASECLCRGSGWAWSELDTLHKCPVHFDGQRHPEDDETPECCCGASVGDACICYAVREEVPDITYDARGNRLV